MKNGPGTMKTMKTHLEPWKTNLELWKTMKTSVELYNVQYTIYRVVTGGCRLLQETPRRKWSFFVTNKHTLHHNIYIISITIITITIMTMTITITIFWLRCGARKREGRARTKRNSNLSPTLQLAGIIINMNHINVSKLFSNCHHHNGHK